MANLSTALQNMGMDPLAMAQGQFGGFNGQGFGMNGMNMNMGMNGSFDGNFQAWNAGMNGDYGANTGYYPQGGYNQQMQQGQVNHMQRAHYHNNYNQNRFRGRGNRRGFGREQQSHPGRSQSNVGMLSTNTSSIADPNAGHGPESQDLNVEPASLSLDADRRELAQKEAEVSHADSIATLTPLEKEGTRALQVNREAATLSKDDTVRQPKRAKRAAPMNDQLHTNGDVRRNSSTEATRDAGPAERNKSLNAEEADYQARPSTRFAHAPDTSDNSKAPPVSAASELKTPGVSGAPTGPKAMREGLPNVRFRVRHGSQANNIASRYGAKPSAPQTPASDPTARPSR